MRSWNWGDSNRNYVYYTQDTETIYVCLDGSGDHTTIQAGIDGPIGNGGSFSKSDLSVGVHTITATVTDSGGLTGFDAARITVFTNTTVLVGAGDDGEDKTLNSMKPIWTRPRSGHRARGSRRRAIRRSLNNRPERLPASTASASRPTAATVSL